MKPLQKKHPNVHVQTRPFGGVAVPLGQPQSPTGPGKSQGAGISAMAERAVRRILSLLSGFRRHHTPDAGKHACSAMQADVGGWDSLSENFEAVFGSDGLFRTANSAELCLSEFVSANAQDVAHVEDGQWLDIAPFGDFQRPDGSAVQRFSPDQGEKVLRTWNSITGTAARYFKNLLHGLGAKSTCPIWDGHPDDDKARYPVERCLGEITDLRTTANALQGRVKWNPKGMASRRRGPLYPSPLWWHMPPSGDPPAVFPELLESVGLDPNPNIRGVRAWTANSALDPLASQQPEAQLKTENTMDRKKIALALGLTESATEADIDAAMQSLRTTANSASTATAQLTTANAQVVAMTTERDLARTALATANTQLTERNTALATLTTERDGLLTDKTTLTTANAALVEGALNIAEKRGLITPADREATRTKLTTANTAAATLAELASKEPVINVQRVEINGNRIDISTANARSEAFNDLVSKRMKDHTEDRDTAFAKVMADSANKALVDAMQQPKQG